MKIENKQLEKYISRIIVMVTYLFLMSCSIVLICSDVYDRKNEMEFSFSISYPIQMINTIMKLNIRIRKNKDLEK